MSEFNVEVFALLMEQGKVDEANAYRAECSQEEWDSLGGEDDEQR